MTTFTHQLLSRKTSMPEVWQCECEYSSRYLLTWPIFHTSLLYYQACS